MQTRSKILGAALLFGAVASPAAFCQQHELSILAGATNPSAQVGIVSAVSVSAGTSFSVQLDYAYRLKETRSGSLYLELPATRVAKVSVGIQTDRVSAAQSRFFVTPGMRYQFAPGSRISPYAVGGFGLGWFDAVRIAIDPPLSVKVADGVKPAFGLGAGARIRISRGLAFRAEIRDFIGCGAVSPRNHMVFQAGFGFRF